jgi:hypothetical protein
MERLNHSVAELLREYRAARNARSAATTKSKSTKSRKRAASCEPVKPERSPAPVDQEPEDDLEDSAEADDPYRVRLERLTRVSHDEYNASSRCALHPCYTFDLARLEHVSRRAYPNALTAQPHDTAPLLDALVLTCGGGIEGVARRAATQIPYEQLLVVENGDTGRIIERLCEDGEMRQAVQQQAEQYLFALMAVENATRHLPEHLRPALNL